MSDELKPCAHCGDAKPILIECMHTGRGVVPFPHWFVESRCGIRTTYYETPEDAAAAWNRRAELSRPADGDSKA